LRRYIHESRPGKKSMMGVAPIAASLTGANGSSSPLSSGNRFGDYGHKLQPSAQRK